MKDSKLLTPDDLIIKQRLSKPKIPKSEVHLKKRKEKLLGKN